ncbi:hypothetical protein ACCO45_002820 [Purpureocillium lilacinum]|uniref:Uncharacterized protein n=1 Tax=Purpureocillium lilacinum TaxID=33203 RepID=A0ACC4DY59_PURLI
MRLHVRFIGADRLARLTGAGPIALDAMRDKQPMPKPVADAMKEISEETIRQGSRIWIDAEQQALQHGLDEWVIDLMRQYNRNGEALIYNTIQAYLKGSQANACRHLKLAAEEGWTAAIKLPETDRSYNSIVNMLLTQRWSTGQEADKFPSVALFLATHNTESAQKALATHRGRVAAGLPYRKTGMRCARGGEGQGVAQAPGVFKCLSWGSVSECMGYLYRRAVENRGAVERTEHMLKALEAGITSQGVWVDKTRASSKKFLALRHVHRLAFRRVCRTHEAMGITTHIASVTGRRCKNVKHMLLTTAQATFTLTVSR